MKLFGPPDVEKLEARRDVRGLIKALSYSEDSRVRSRAAEALGRIGDARAVEPLITALKDIQAPVLESAATALGQLRDARAVQPLIAAYRDMRESVQQAAVAALGSIGAPEALPVLFTALKKGSPQRRVGAAVALGQIGDAGAVPPLLDALRDPEHAVRWAAAMALDLVDWQPEGGEAGATYWIVKGEWDKCAAGGAAAVEPLIAALGDQLASAKARWALQEIGAPAVEGLLRIVDNQDPLRLTPAVMVLGELGEARAVKPLAACLSHWHADVRMEAAVALAKMGDPRGVRSLVAGLTSAGDSIRKGVLRARLTETGAPCVEALVLALDDQDPLARQAVAEVLGRLRDSRAVAPLIAHLRDGVQSVRKAAAEALGQIRWEPASSEERALWERVLREPEPDVRAVRAEMERQRIALLERLCDAYAASDDSEIRRLEPEATRIGEELNAEGGLGAMQYAFNMVQYREGSRRLQFHWDGIGDWLGYHRYTSDALG